MLKDSKVHFLLSFQQRKNFTFFPKVNSSTYVNDLIHFCLFQYLNSSFKSSFNPSSFILYIIDSFIISIFKYLYFIGTKISSLVKKKKMLPLNEDRTLYHTLDIHHISFLSLSLHGKENIS